MTNTPQDSQHYNAHEKTSPYVQQYLKSPQQVEADKLAQTSMIFGILAIVGILPIVFGPLAIVKAKAAERLGAASTIGKVLGWIATVLSVIAIIFFAILIVVTLAAGSAQNH